MLHSAVLGPFKLTNCKANRITELNFLSPQAGSSPTSSSNSSVNPMASLGALQSLAASSGAGLNMGSLAGIKPST